MLVYDLDFQSLANLLESWNEPLYRAMQLWQGLYQHFYYTPEQFTNLPISLRERIRAELDFEGIQPIRFLDSNDHKTEKTLFKLKDDYLIEAVLMKYDKGVTLCISTQAGCAMGCVFCATGQMGFNRHLSSGEITAQVMYYARILKSATQTVTNVVLMGMGEPFHNYENSMAAIDRLNDAEGYNLGARRFTISTVGIVPMIKRFANEKRQVNLAVSLHAADDDLRSSMMPVNKRWAIDEVLDACRYYVNQTGRRVSFEWALINGVNDTMGTAKHLASLLKGLLCHVNVIPLNPTAGYAGQAAKRDNAVKFKTILEQADIPCTIRMRRGIDIQAGCGQLAGYFS
jgi:23S rRNA (adenine2503-C2)-methyltransferase